MILELSERMNLLDTLKTSFTPVLTQVAPEAEKVPDYLGMIKPAQNSDHGDYQANFAMPLSKPLKRKPPEIASEIVGKLPLGEMLEAPQVAGPGFINLRFKNDWLADRVREMARSERLGIDPAAKAKTFVIDYSSPNVAKPLHVGHLRSTIIGESLCRILRFLGHKVVADNHLGDWGTQFGMLLFGYKHFRNRKDYKKNPVRELAKLYLEVRRVEGTLSLLQVGYEKFRDEAAFQRNPIEELNRLYLKGMDRLRNKGDEDDDDDEPKVPNPVTRAYREETVKLHQGDQENLELWREFMPHCLDEIQKIYDRLEVKFDHQYGESFYHDMLPGVVEDLGGKKVVWESEGAIVFQENEKSTISLIRKRDGAFTYTTTDLATIKYRVETWKPDAILYLVDFRQGDHFKNLFSLARKWGYGDVKLEHISFGSVLDKDGKPLMTRAGGAVELGTLLDEAVRTGQLKYLEHSLQRFWRGDTLPEMTQQEIAQIAETVGIGAVKYADLSQNRTSDYKFDYDKMLATDGNTATYMQYAYVRCRGIFRKEAIDDSRFRSDPPKVLIVRPEERALVLQLLRFSEALDMAATEYMPNHLTSYLWDLAKAYSGFFVNCPVLKAETEELKLSRLLLCDLTARVIQKTLELLGIKTVERM